MSIQVSDDRKLSFSQAKPLFNFTAKVGGQEVPAESDAKGTTVSLIRNGPARLLLTFKDRGKPVQFTQWTISVDGRTLTSEDTSADNKERIALEIYEKQ